jgi:tripartite-type tricarboxylate transporter receptor subunit TctC
MQLTRRALLGSCALAPIALSTSAGAQQPFPTRPIRFIAIASPGTALDVTARYIAKVLGDRLQTSVVVENKVGANGIIAATYVAKSPPDGYTLLFSGAPHYTNRWTSETPLPFDTLKDFAPIAKVNNSPLVFVVPTSSPYTKLMDLINDMRARPGEVTYSSAGTGSTTQLCTVVLNDMTKTVARHIPYKGASGATTDTVSGQVAFSCIGCAPAIPLLKGGRLRGLGVTSAKRLEALPDCPTVEEAGVPGYDMTTWLGILAPGATPPDVVKKLSDEVVAVASTEDFKSFCRAQALNVDIADASTLKASLPQEFERWRRIVALSHKA